jgi:hypothetical protein
MGTFNQLLTSNYVGGVGFFAILSGILWAYRVIMLYCQETRDEYRNRLNEAVLELEQQKTTNIRLELRIQTMEFLNTLREGK